MNNLIWVYFYSNVRYILTLVVYSGNKKLLEIIDITYNPITEDFKTESFIKTDRQQLHSKKYYIEKNYTLLGGLPLWDYNKSEVLAFAKYMLLDTVNLKRGDTYDSYNQ